MNNEDNKPAESAGESISEMAQQLRNLRPTVWHPQGQLDSEVHTDIGRIIAAHESWFIRGDKIVTIKQMPAGFKYSADASKHKIAAHTIGLDELSALAARSDLEKYMIPMALTPDKKSVKKSFSIPFCLGLVNSDFLRRELPRINRILTVPLPFRDDKKLVYPSPGYDQRFGTYLVPGAPEIRPMPLEEAKEVIEEIHAEFPFTSGQSKTHAIARLLTPFIRGIIGWTTRAPLWYFCANRPRVGKDYLAAIALLVYEGHAMEDLPIDRNPEETGKRLVAAGRSGRRFMHFADCQGYLQDQNLLNAITNPMIAARRLGSNEGSSDLRVPNEMDFSLSAQAELTYKEDFEPRMRQIEMAYFEEDPNARQFRRNPHKEIAGDRSRPLSALNALVANWAQEGFPEGQTPFTSFHDWAESAGGIMMAADLGDPCLPFKSQFKDVGGDRRLLAMKELYQVCYDKWGSADSNQTGSVSRQMIYQCVRQEVAAGNEALSFFNDATQESEQTKLSKVLRSFVGRALGGIRLIIDSAEVRTQRQKFKFVLVSQRQS